MQAIITKWHAATNTKPAHMTAKCQAGSVSINNCESHRQACEALRAKLGWTHANGYAPMISGSTKDFDVWVSLPREGKGDTNEYAVN